LTLPSSNISPAANIAAQNSAQPNILPAFAAEIGRLNAIYCPALVFAGQYLQDWCFLPPSWIHDRMLRDITQSDKHCVIVGPREFAKSRISMIAELYDAIMLRRLDQMHVAADSTLAEAQLGHIIQQFETNAFLTNAFHIRAGKTQRADHYEIKIGKAHPTTVLFRARGFGGSIRGLHPSRIVLDDIETSMDGPSVMQKNYNEIHGTILGALKRTDTDIPGQLVVVGNYLGPHCTIRRIQDIDARDNHDQWISRTLSAIELGKTTEITRSVVGESVWPQFRTTEQLNDLRRTMNAGQAFSFETEYLNQLISPADTVWQPEMFAERWTELPPRHLLVGGVFIDPAEKVTERGDETAIVTLFKQVEGIDAGRIFVVDASIRKVSQPDLCKEAIRQYISALGSRLIPFCDWCYVEGKTTKGDGALVALLRQTARENSVNMNLQTLVPQTYGDKRQRALKVVDIARQGKVMFPENLSADMRKLLEQLYIFTGKKDQHQSAVDDGHDAFVWGLMMMKDVTRHNAQFEPLTMKSKMQPIRSYFP